MSNIWNVEIDWSKAPEGATHYDRDFALFCCESGWWYESGEYRSGKNVDWGTNRYISLPFAWDGESIPPVGVVCEVFRCRSWVECKVFAHAPSGDRVDVLFTFTDEDGVQDWSYEDSNDLRFMRPIKSPEQIAAEKRDKEVSEIAAILSGYSSLDGAELLYDAGYRKPEQTK